MSLLDQIRPERHQIRPDVTVPAPDAVPVEGSEAGEAAESVRTTRGASGWLAALRIGTGFVFLWAFLDKLFGLGYATPSDGAWIDGGSPTEGFLSHVSVGPFESTFQSWAGDAWADWLFMLGLAGVGVAVIAGIGLRLAAVSGTVMMALMWAAEWPLAKHLSTGEPSGSNNPLVDYHIIYALALIAVAVTHAGDHYGLGRLWKRIPFVRRHRSILS
jgi:thiosulfate dehydrogenase [quinone] large subunit